MIKLFSWHIGWHGKDGISGLTSIVFVVPCRSGPVWTVHCSCHLFLQGLRASQPWCWPTTGWRVSSGSSQKSPRCRAWLSCWWCGTIRTKVPLKVSVPRKLDPWNIICTLKPQKEKLLLMKLWLQITHYFQFSWLLSELAAVFLQFERLNNSF